MNKKTVIITGAAGGIGSAMVAEFVEAGYEVAAVDRDRQRLDDLSKTFASEDLAIFPIDLTEFDALGPLVDEIADRFGRLDVLVNNAALSVAHSLRTMPDAEWHAVIATNLTAPAFLMRQASRRMTRGGVIINISSIEGTLSKGVATAYTAAKSGLLGLTFDTAVGLAPSGIRVVAVSPGAVDTTMGVKGDEIEAASLDMIPAQRWAQPSEIARAVRWLASEEASYITGTEITIDGGVSHAWIPRSVVRRAFPDHTDQPE